MMQGVRMVKKRKGKGLAGIQGVGRAKERQDGPGKGTEEQVRARQGYRGKAGTR